MRGKRRAYADDRERAQGSPLARAKEAERSADVSPVAGEALRLQRSGGNEAVGSLLARQESPLARDDDERSKPVSFTLLLPEPVNVMPLISFSRGRDEKEMTVIIPSTASDPTLVNWLTSGKQLGTVTISGRVTITIADAMVSGCRLGDPVELTLNGEVAAG